MEEVQQLVEEERVYLVQDEVLWECECEPFVEPQVLCRSKLVPDHHQIVHHLDVSQRSHLIIQLQADLLFPVQENLLREDVVVDRDPLTIGQFVGQQQAGEAHLVEAVEGHRTAFAQVEVNQSGSQAAGPP